MFGRGKHCSRGSFKRRNGNTILAHAFIPSDRELAGDAHFNDAELWVKTGASPGKAHPVKNLTSQLTHWELT